MQKPPPISTANKEAADDSRPAAGREEQEAAGRPSDQSKGEAGQADVDGPEKPGSGIQQDAEKPPKQAVGKGMSRLLWHPSYRPERTAAESQI